MEPQELAEARSRLAHSEAAFESEEGLLHLQAALALLERVVDASAGDDARAIARNLGATHARAVYRRMESRLQSEQNIPEPELEHTFRVIRAFDDRCFELPAQSRALKIEVVKRLVELYYEGYGAAEKQRILEQLAGIAEG